MRQWTEFQKSCVQHIAGLLHSIKGLVEILGHDALKHYCHQGCLGQPCVDRVRMAEFVQPDTEIHEEPEDSASESENGDEGPEDGNGGYRDADEDSEDDYSQETLFVPQGPLEHTKDAED